MDGVGLPSRNKQTARRSAFFFSLFFGSLFCFVEGMGATLALDARKDASIRRDLSTDMTRRRRLWTYACVYLGADAVLLIHFVTTRQPKNLLWKEKKKKKSNFFRDGKWWNTCVVSGCDTRRLFSVVLFEFVSSFFFLDRSFWTPILFIYLFSVPHSPILPSIPPPPPSPHHLRISLLTYATTRTTHTKNTQWLLSSRDPHLTSKAPLLWMALSLMCPLQTMLANGVTFLRLGSLYRRRTDIARRVVLFFYPL